MTSPAGSRVAQRSNHGEGAGEPGMFGDYDLDHRQNNLVIDLCMMRDPAFSDWNDHSGLNSQGVQQVSEIPLRALQVDLTETTEAPIVEFGRVELSARGPKAKPPAYLRDDSLFPYTLPHTPGGKGTMKA